MDTIAIAVLGLLFLVGCFFVAFAGVTHQFDEDEKPIPVTAHRHPHGERCALCDAPLRPLQATSDDVVHELELRIDDTRATVSEVLANPEPANIKRLYLS